MSEWSARRFALALVAVLSVGVALRALPLLQSPLPFNPDGIVYSGNVARAARTGHLPLSTMAVDSLGFGSFLTVLHLVTGERSLYISQPTIAIVGTLPALLAAVLARRFGHRRGWTAGRARYAGALAAAILAVEGLYLYRSMPVDEQTPGLFLLPLALVGVVLAFWNGERRWFVAAIPMLAFLPPLHNLESVAVGVTLVVLVGVAAVRPGRRRVTLGLGAVSLGFWVVFVGYTLGMARFTPAVIIQTDRLTDAPGLFLAWTVVVLFGVAWFDRVSERGQRLLLAVPFVTVFALLCVNVVVPVFPGTSQTPTGLLLPTLALVIPVGVACWGYPAVARVPENRLVLVALFVGPLTIVGFTLSAELTPVYVSSGLRASWFVHLPLAVLVGVTLAGFVGEFPLASRPPVRVATVALVLVLVAVSVPVSFSGLAALSYQGVTTPGEFAASTFANERIVGPWASDDHLVRITRYYGSNQSGTVTPVYSWIHDGGTPPDCPVLTKRSWTTVGAQFYPRPPASIAPERLDVLDRRAHRIYDGGGTDRIRGFVPSTGRARMPCPASGASFRTGFTGP